MKNTFENGAIVAYGKQFEKTKYDVSNYTLGACFNGQGGIEYYSVTDGASFEFPISFINLSYNGEIQNVLIDKKVTMLGRTQTIELDLKGAVLKIEQFLDTKENGIFTCYTLLTKNKSDILELGLLGNYFSDDTVLTNSKVLSGYDKILVSDSDMEYVK